MIISVEGEEKTTKSSFGLTAPLPIVMFSFDMGHERAIYGKLYPEYFKDLKLAIHPYQEPEMSWKDGRATAKVTYEPFEGNDVTVYELPKPMQMDPNKVEGFMAQWSYFLTIYVAAIQSKTVQTIDIDTATLLYKNKVDAYLEELNNKNGVGTGTRKQLLQIEYGHPNGEIRSVYDLAQSSSKNLVAVHHLRDHYVNVPNSRGEIESKPDGTLEADGMKETERKVDVVLRMEKKKEGIAGKIMTCGLNLGLEGNSIPFPTWDKLMDQLEAGWYGKPFPRRKNNAD